ncbi:MAG: hypothetical protein ACKV19_28450 [Verrucomicrobiales bacterium]
MTDKSSRWERIDEKSVDKPAFSPRQSTDAFRQPTTQERPHRRSRRHHSRLRSGRTWYFIGIGVLGLLAAILAWQLFAS